MSVQLSSCQEVQLATYLPKVLLLGSASKKPGINASFITFHKIMSAAACNQHANARRLVRGNNGQITQELQAIQAELTSLYIFLFSLRASYILRD